MPDATITSTASTFGTISGVFSADQSTISGTISGIVPGTLTGSVGVPGPAGAAGQGVPVGGTAGQFLTKIDGTNYNTDWTTVNLSAYAVKANNLSDLTNFATARDNLNLGTLNSPVFAGVTAQGSGANVANLTPTSLSLTHATSGSFVIQPSVGITFPDASVQTTAFTTSQLTAYLAKASNLSDLASTSTARTNLGLGSLAVVNDAPSDGSQYARKNGAWDVVTTTPDYITSVSSPLSVTSGNLTIDLSAYAPLASPAFTGNPTAPTAALGDNDTSLATTAFVQQELAGGTAVARNLEVEVRNQSGSTIAAGSIVYISGATGNKPLITLAQANNDANSAQTMGFTKESIANNGFGYVIVRGELENIDTSALTEGAQLYLSPTVAGTWTTTKPSAPQHLVYVGIVIRSHPTLGTILVAVQNGYELDELHDVAIGTLANNDLLAYESSTDLWKNKTYSALGLLTSADAASTYAPLASPALTGNVTITSNSTGAALFIEQSGTGNILTLHDQASDTNFVAIDQNGKVSTIPSTTANAGFNVAHGVAPTTPVNGDIWTTTSGLFMRQNGSTKQYVDLDGTQTINGAKTFSGANQTLGNATAAGTINVGTGATISGATKTLNIGTAGVSGSTTNVTVGSSVAGAGVSVTVNGSLTTTGVTQNIGNSTAASTISLGAGATISGSTKSVNIGTSGVAGSTTNIAIGSTTGTSTTTLQGITNGITQTAGDSSLKLATTAFVTTADNLKANLASPALTGTPTAPTATAGTNTTQIATTAFVTSAVPAAATHTQALQFSSTSAFTKVIDASSQLIAPSVLKVWPSPSNYNGTATSGAGASAVLYLTGYILTSPSAGVAGNARAFHGNVAGDLAGMLWGGTNADIINFSRRVSMAFRFAQFPSSTASVTRVLLGKIHGTAVGDLTSRGIGVKYVPNGANFDFQLQVHNGTTLTSVTSSTQYAGGVADLEVVSDGAGNATLYLNGASVATTTGAPTGQTGANATVFAEIESTASTANQPAARIGRLYVNTLNF
jgi:hypothetical protein